MTAHQILMTTHQNLNDYTSKLKITTKSKQTIFRNNYSTLSLVAVLQADFFCCGMSLSHLVFELLYFEAAAGITTNFESTSGSFATAV
jgi:hypothetical protein